MSVSDDVLFRMSVSDDVLFVCPLQLVKKEGTGSEMPMTGDKVFVHYVGTLLDGSKFDSSRDRDDKFNFELGKGTSTILSPQQAHTTQSAHTHRVFTKQWTSTSRPIYLYHMIIL